MKIILKFQVCLDEQRGNVSNAKITKLGHPNKDINAHMSSNQPALVKFSQNLLIPFYMENYSDNIPMHLATHHHQELRQ